ncbi:hypothetical protein DL351_19630 [Pseudomonas aeruginosa]|uniref:hypothetical protein n=1 Tax=Pseudomonas aeruginosa TaxID=287 RepID=UPI00071C0DB3|nr:hypothetical protein [Pseudomonas aeruginosa]AYW41561.1 hypothetical protein DL351_19630 [Pseudomonas aeruginosa]KSQ09341.1 hypothetical protein APB28_34130 [Pseudomonas aeruginosa]HCL4035959.1 hypothetical protein [Pseudomonas aeruginosa]
MKINANECLAAGLDQKEVRRIAAGISRYARQAEALGLTVFGGGAGDLRTRSDGCRAGYIVATLDGNFDGGDGGHEHDENGLLRGESC